MIAGFCRGDAPLRPMVVMATISRHATNAGDVRLSGGERAL
jgi:hypothetical protein